MDLNVLAAQSTRKTVVMPFQFLLIIVVMVFLAEFSIMIGFSILPPIPPMVMVFIDSSFLICLIFPVLYFLSYRPQALSLIRQKELEKTKETLTQMLVHDFNNPITVALGNLQILEMEMGGHLSDEQRKEVGDALESLTEIKNMTADLLDISTMQENTLKLHKTEINIPEHIKKIINLMSYLAGQGGKTVISSVPPSLPSLFADEEILQRVISNLIRNALKFTPVNSRIEVCVDYKAENRDFVFSVKDNGLGIPKEYLEKIFDKYVRYNSDRAQVVPGKGLGLAFCKMAVETHGGRIWAESEAGKGSTFYFTIPQIKTA